MSTCSQFNRMRSFSRVVELCVKRNQASISKSLSVTGPSVATSLPTDHKADLKAYYPTSPLLLRP